jgi:hypothetical protein
MKAVVLTYDRYRRITEHMLKTYEKLWPDNQFLFLIPFQNDVAINPHGQNIELIPTPRTILATIKNLVDRLSDDEWVYWCVDDKFLLAIDAGSASYFSQYVSAITDERITGLSFCRARYLLRPPHVSERPIATSGRGDPLLARYNYNNIWLHQFIRVSALRNLFEGFPRHDFAAIEMDGFTRQGPKALEVAPHETMYVTEQNFVVFGESTIGGRVTRGCLENMTRLGIEHPTNFQVDEKAMVIGTRGDLRGS